MLRVPSPEDAREEQRAETRASVPLGLQDDGRRRQRVGNDAINPYNIDDIKRAYAPSNGKGSPDQILREIDFEWKAYDTYGKLNYTTLQAHEVQGWRPCQHSDFRPGRFAPPGTEGAVHVNDMILMHRPMRLTVEARQEDYVNATRSMEVNRKKMAVAPEGQAPRTEPDLQTERFTIEIPDK